MLDVVLAIDVEDVYFDESEGGDDHPLWISDVLKRCGLVGTFLFVGDKIRRLKANGRHDVARAMDGHSIGIHTNSNVHPTMPEYTAQLDWFEALEKVRSDEQACAADFEDFFGRSPDATSRHSCFGSTQRYAVAAEMNIPSFYGVPASVPAVGDISFCCGALNTPCGDLPGWIGTGFDRSYSDDDRTDDCIKQIDRQIERCLEANKTFLNIFLGHPVMFRGVSPWFIYFLWPNGQNLSRSEADALGQASLKPVSVMPSVQRNFERVCRHIAQHPDIEVIGAPEMQRRYDWHQPSVNHDEISAYIDRLSGAIDGTPRGYVGDIPLADHFSPAEMLVAIAESVAIWSRDGSLPAEVPRRNILGPIDVPVICPELACLTKQQIMDSAKPFQQEVTRTGYLPGNVLIDGRRIGLGSYLQGMSNFYRQLERSKEVESVQLTRESCRYPSFAHEIDAMWRQIIMEDGVIDPLIDLELFCRHARLQSWTVKPAHRRS